MKTTMKSKLGLALVLVSLLLAGCGDRCGYRTAEGVCAPAANQYALDKAATK